MRRNAIALFAGTLIVVAGSSQAQVAAPALPAVALTTTQLPRVIRPTHYEVAIVPDAAALTFGGKVVIGIEVLQPTARITLNAIDLSFSRVQLSDATGKAMFAAPKVSVNADAQTATFTFALPIPKGHFQLALDYTGKIGTQAVGLFALDYDSPTGHKRALYTQFENSDARRFIPSWDEPAYKATFTLAATVPSTGMVVSNMPASNTTTLGDGRTRITFAQSPRMSTYLLFFAMGDFDRATDKVDGTEIGVITQKGAIAQAAFGLQSAKAILHEYNDYFATTYPLPKLDNIAAPGSSQFFGAMENWGAIFTFENDLLLDPTISTQDDKQGVFETAAHEMAHQWFGDLVTMRWWDDLWLNEGFASWMESRTTQLLHPEWNTVMDTVNTREAAMKRDAFATTHPVVQHVETVEQANQAFDAITYEKGEAVIGMLESYVGADAWRAGVRRYMHKHNYGNTVSDDLWREIDAGAGKPITAIAHDFTLQPGVPMITVSDATCQSGQTVVKLTQGEFSVDQTDKKPLVWRVPVILSSLGASDPVRTLVSGGTATARVPGCSPLIVNAGQSGYYRTLYPPAQFAGLVKNFSSIAAIDQLGIMSDSWSLGLAGLEPPTDFLQLAKVTPLDADPQVWEKIASVLSSIDDYYNTKSSQRTKFRMMAIGLLTPKFAQVGWTARPDELGTTVILRNEMIATLSELDDPLIISETRRRYAAQTSDPTAVPVPLRKAILSVLAYHADTATWEHLHAMALAEKTPLVKQTLYALLASSEDSGLARSALKLALTSEPGATNSGGMILTVARLHPELAFDFAIAHMPAVNEKIDPTSRSSFFPSLASRSLDPAMIGKVNAYATANLAAGSRRNANTAAANIAYGIKIRSERLPAITAWLAHQ
jgi:aminopeptidase N